MYINGMKSKAKKYKEKKGKSCWQITKDVIN